MEVGCPGLPVKLIMEAAIEFNIESIPLSSLTNYAMVGLQGSIR